MNILERISAWFIKRKADAETARREALDSEKFPIEPDQKDEEKPQ